MANVRTASASILLVPVLLVACAPTPERTGDAPPGAVGAELTHEDPVRRGEYLVTVGGCNDCHTPWVLGEEGLAPDTSRRLSGHPQNLEMPPAPELPEGPWVWLGAGTNTAFAGPWGVTYATNLTPDENTGLGIWTEEMFLRAMKEGRHMGQGRPILPPMPWQNLAQMTEEDLRAVFAYLQSLEPIRNRVPEYQPPPGGAPGATPAPTAPPEP